MHWNNYQVFIPLFVTFNTFAVVPLSGHRSLLNNDVLESSSSTELQVTKFRFTWTIKNFSLYSKTFDEKVTSPTFSDGTNENCKCQLEMCPTQSDNNSGSASISLVFLCPYDYGTISAQYKLGIINAKRKEINVWNGSGIFNYDLERASHDNFINQNYLMLQENGILLDDTLTIFCEIKTTHSGSTSQKSRRNLKTDLAVLLENEEFSDFTLDVRGTEFKSFKVILSARSPVFKDMFERDANITELEVTDVDPDVMKEILRYMYTDEASNLENLVLDLLVAAEKYKLNGLKAIAENSISEKLTIENAAELYILADTHSAEKLKTQVKNFVVSHTSAVSHTNGFRSMMKTHRYLIIELFSSL